MKRQVLRLGLAVLLVFVTAVAAWLWSAEYASESDEAARMEVEAVQVVRDRSYCWVEIHLKKVGEKPHDLQRPVGLVVDGKGFHEPADTTFAGNPDDGFTEVWFKFWLEEEELEHLMKLRINEGELWIKKSPGQPDLGDDGRGVFRNADWERSWLGF